MDYSDFIHATLKTLKWRKMTKHYKQTLLPSHAVKEGFLMTASDKWFIVNKADEVARIPYWLVLLMAGHRDLSDIFGPYMFYNNFELTAEAAYLRQMFKYRILTPTAETKVRSLLQQYKPLVGINETFVDALIEREGCPNYWEEVTK